MMQDAFSLALDLWFYSCMNDCCFHDFSVSHSQHSYQVILLANVHLDRSGNRDAKRRGFTDTSRWCCCAFSLSSDFFELKICREPVRTIRSFWNRNAQIGRAEVSILRRERGTRKADLDNKWGLLLDAA